MASKRKVFFLLMTTDGLEQKKKESSILRQRFQPRNGRSLTRQLHNGIRFLILTTRLKKISFFESASNRNEPCRCWTHSRILVFLSIGVDVSFGLPIANSAEPTATYLCEDTKFGLRGGNLVPNTSTSGFT